MKTERFGLPQRLLVLVLLPFCGWADEIPSITRMPDLPQPYILRDWKKVALDFDRLVFDWNRTGEHLPLIWADHSRKVNDVNGFGIPSYVGDSRQHPESNHHEAISSLAAVLGSTLIGMDMSEREGRDYVAMLPVHFDRKNGIGLYLNQPGTRGDSFWYDLLPSLLFYQISFHYPDTPRFQEQFLSTAQKWREVLIKLGASKHALPNFDHTGFDLIDMKPVDRGWNEPDAAAALACIQYLAYRKTGKKEFLEAADWCFHWLRERKENPYYESLLPYGAYATARSNAERGTNFPTAKLIEWVLAGDNPRKWGAMKEKLHETEAFGLIGSVYPNYEYAFAMNSFQAAGIIAPVARYEETLSIPIAKWVLNLAVNARYFYPNAWPPENQSSFNWSARYDPDFCIPYEGLRKQGMTRDYPVSEKMSRGEIIAGNPRTPDHDLTWVADENGEIEYRCSISIPPGMSYKLIMKIRDPDILKDSRVDVLVSQDPQGNFKPGLQFRKNHGNLRTHPLMKSGQWWIRISSAQLRPFQKIKLDDLVIETRFKNPPHVGGDPTIHGWGQTDLGIYGGAYASFLGAMLEKTNIEGILSLDLTATDVGNPESYPTRLLYNPFEKTHRVQIRQRAQSVDLYEAQSNRWIEKNLQPGKNFFVSIPPKKSITLVYCPAGGELEKQDRQLRCNGLVIDFNCEKAKP